MNLETCVELAVALVPEDVRTRFAANPLSVLRQDFGLTVTAVQDLADARNDGGACDGISFLRDGVLLYAPTTHSRRENFTLAHELGHWLIDEAEGIYDWAADQEQPGRVLETICDRIAQLMLLPDNVVDSIIETGPVQARNLLDLYCATQASRPVCAIALAKRIPSLGAVVIIDRYTRMVTHSSVKPDPEDGWPTVFPWRGQELPDGHSVLSLNEKHTTTRRMQWRMPWGTQAYFYVDAIAEDRRIIAVFAGSDIWGVERFPVNLGIEFDSRPHLEVHCCGTTSRVRGYPCPTCQQPFCPRCSRCRCERQAARETRCQKCFLNFQPHLVVNDLCQECRS